MVRIRLFKTAAAQLHVTLLAVWGVGHDQAWMLVTSAAPRAIHLSWYGLRDWIEAGFRDVKAMGWQWERTQRQAAQRVARHWLVLALATIWALAAGTVAEEAARQGVPRALVVRPALPPPPLTGTRTVSAFTRGCTILRRRLIRGALTLQDWLLQEAWPEPPPTLFVTFKDGLYSVISQSREWE